MSALSRGQILKRLQSKELVVSPIVDINQVGPSSIDLRMGTVALMARAGAQSHVTATAYRRGLGINEYAAIRGRQQKHERFDVPFGQKFLLHPGSLVLVPTLEWVKIPDDLQGMVTARSSWAREGLNIATATLINPRYRGIVTLELANFGEIPIELIPGLRLAQLALYHLDVAPTPKSLIPAAQFDMSFEPSAGSIARGDEAFINQVND